MQFVCYIVYFPNEFSAGSCDHCECQPQTQPMSSGLITAVVVVPVIVVFLIGIPVSLVVIAHHILFVVSIVNILNRMFLASFPGILFLWYVFKCTLVMLPFVAFHSYAILEGREPSKHKATQLSK